MTPRRLTTAHGRPSTDYAGLLVDRTAHGWAIYGDPTSNEAMALLRLWRGEGGEGGGLLVDQAITDCLGAGLAVARSAPDLSAWRCDLHLPLPDSERDAIYELAID